MKNTLMLSLALALCMFFTPAYLFSQIQDDVIDDAGDIAFVAYEGNPTSQGVAFVFLDNCPNGTAIRFSDEEWTGTAFATPTGEGELEWINNTGSVITRGTVIRMNPTTATNNWAVCTTNIGSLTQTDAGFSNALSNDQVFAYLGTRSAPTIPMLAFYGCATGCATPNTLTGTGLTAGVTAADAGSSAISLIYNGSTVCNGTIVACATMINTMSNWAVGTYPASVPTAFTGSALPIELISFDAKREQKGHLLQWMTATEQDSYGFEIERSTNGIYYEGIGFMPGKGNSTTRQHYLFTDESPVKGINYYRLRMVDMDGSAAYSPVRVLKNGVLANILLSPNPVKQGNSTTLIYESTIEEDLVITVFNALGAGVSQQQFSAQKGNNQLVIDVSALASGRYVAHILNSSGLGDVVQVVIE